MNKKEKEDRKPVPENTCRAFMGTMWTTAKMAGIDKIPAACHYLQLACEEINRHMFEQKNPAVTHHKEDAERRRYLTIFKTRFRELGDFEYSTVVTPVEAKMVSQLCESLAEKGFSADEYLKWLFEDFLPKNDKFSPPQLKWTCCGFAVHKFLYENKDLMNKRKGDKLNSKLTTDLINRARVCMRKASEQGKTEDAEKIKKVIKDFWDGGIVIDEMRRLVEEYELALRQT